MAQLLAQLVDITSLEVDAIVNAANTTLLGGSGVDGAIHRAAGQQLIEACRAIPHASPGVRGPTGQARITPGFDLHAKWVIHTVGPVYDDGRSGEPELLASCYRSCMALAAQHAVASIAFPAISCGVYGYPFDQAAAIAVRTVRAELPSAPTIQRVTFAVFSDEILAAYQRALRV